MTQITTNGNSYSDDGSSSRDMRNGGHRTWFFSLLSDILADLLGKQTSAANSAAAAANSAASAANAPGTSATSTTSLAVQMGQISIQLAQTTKQFAAGQTIMIASTASPSNWMCGTLTDPTNMNVNGWIGVNITNISGSGTFASWTVSLSGPAGVTGVLNELRGADIAVSAAGLLDLINITGNYVELTSSAAATITDIAIPRGASRVVYVAGGAAGTILQHSPAHNLYVPGQANITLAQGDIFEVRGDGTNIAVVTSYSRYSGLPIKNPTTLQPGLMCLSAVDIAAGAASVQFTIDPSYDEHIFEVVGVVPSATAALQLAMSTDNGATFGVLMDAVMSYQTGASGGVNGTTAGASTAVQLTAAVDQTPTFANAGGISASVKCFNLGSSVKRKQVIAHVCNDNNTTPVISQMNALVRTIGAVTNAKFMFSTGTLSSGSIRLYGVRKAPN